MLNFLKPPVLTTLTLGEGGGFKGVNGVFTSFLKNVVFPEGGALRPVKSITNRIKMTKNVTKIHPRRGGLTQDEADA